MLSPSDLLVSLSWEQNSLERRTWICIKARKDSPKSALLYSSHGSDEGHRIQEYQEYGGLHEHGMSGLER